MRPILERAVHHRLEPRLALAQHLDGRGGGVPRRGLGLDQPHALQRQYEPRRDEVGQQAIAGLERPIDGPGELQRANRDGAGVQGHAQEALGRGAFAPRGRDRLAAGAVPQERAARGVNDGARPGQQGLVRGGGRPGRQVAGRGLGGGREGGGGRKAAGVEVGRWTGHHAAAV
ncbi:MAG: hypothetical protein R2708_04670 [Vicinamibacterales bacterium]